MDRDEIVDTLNRYAAALDSHGWDLFDLIFTPDVEADYPGVLHWFDLKTFKAEFGVYHEALANHQHLMTNHQVLVQGDRANSLVYGTFRLVEAERDDQSGGIREGCGWYDDELIRTDAGWRICKRTARVFWMRGTAPGRAVSGEEPIALGSEMGSLVTEAKAGRVAYFNALRAANGLG